MGLGGSGRHERDESSYRAERNYQILMEIYQRAIKWKRKNVFREFSRRHSQILTCCIIIDQ